MSLKSIIVNCIERSTRAPSSHNSQPWRFHVQENQVQVFAEGSLRLVETDLDGRELMISCGTVIEALLIALEAEGLRTTITECDIKNIITKDLIELCVIAVERTEGHQPSKETIELNEQIDIRRTFRGKYLDDELSENDLKNLTESITLEDTWFHQITSQTRRSLLADMILDANEAQWNNTKWRKELAHWIRPTSAGDGLNIGPDIFNTITCWAVSHFAFLGSSQGHGDRNMALSAPVLGVFGTNKSDPKTWLRLGRSLMRFLLVASKSGICASYFNQPLQVKEFGYLRVSEAIGKEEGCPCLILRLGRVPTGKSWYSPRKPIEEILI